MKNSTAKPEWNRNASLCHSRGETTKIHGILHRLQARSKEKYCQNMLSNDSQKKQHEMMQSLFFQISKSQSQQSHKSSLKSIHHWRVWRWFQCVFFSFTPHLKIRICWRFPPYTTYIFLFLFPKQAFSVRREMQIRMNFIRLVSITQLFTAYTTQCNSLRPTFIDFITQWC